MESLQAQFAAFGVAALVVYLILRAISPRGSQNQLAQARLHARWCAVIGFFAATSTDWFDAFYRITADGQQADISWPAAVGRAATPALWVCFIYIASQFTLQRSLRPQRSTSLRPRTLTGLIPRSLVGGMLLVLTASVVALFAVRDVAYRAPVPAKEIFEDEASYTEPAYDGMRSAAEVLPFLALCLGLLVVAAALATVVILRRRPLPGISEHDNRLLRQVWLNRLYRTVSVLLAINAGAALHYKARWFHDGSSDYLDGQGAGIEHMELFSALGSRWDSVANYSVTAIALVMLFWRPPQDFEGLTPLRSTAVQRMRDHLFCMQFLALCCLFIAFSAAWPPVAQVDQFQVLPTGERPMRIMALIAGSALLYLVVTALVMAYVSIKARSLSAMERQWAPLPRRAYAVAGILVLISGYFLLRPPLDYLWGLVPAPGWFVLLLMFVLLVAHGGLTILSRKMLVPWDVDSRWEKWYRQVLELRSLRTVTAAIGAMLLLGYGFPDGWLGLCLVLLCLPALLVLQRPSVVHPRSTTRAAERPRSRP